jgi:DNA-binding transcriptional regulator YhcF (GntR family)
VAWKLDAKLPVSYQIAQKLRQDILIGNYAPGSQFPPVRQLAVEASVNPNTVQKALLTLEEEGLLVTRGTVGRFVTDDIAVLDRTRDFLHREFVCHVAQKAAELGITREELAQTLLRMEEET